MKKTGNDLKVHSIRIQDPSSIELYLPEVHQSLVCIILRINNVDRKKNVQFEKGHRFEIHIYTFFFKRPTG